MVLIANKDTYAVESVGGGVEVRRRVVAGQQVPDNWDLDDAGAVDEVNVASGIATYKPEQITTRVNVDATGDITPAEGGEQPVAEEAEEAEPSHARRSRKAD